jgi:hypothetical protein
MKNEDSLANELWNQGEVKVKVMSRLCLSFAVERCVNFVATLWILQAYPLLRIRVLASRCLAMNCSGFQALCHNVYVYAPFPLLHSSHKTPYTYNRIIFRKITIILNKLY